MLVLALSDIHSRTENLKKILKLIHNRGVGLALISGDLTNFGGKKQAFEALDMLSGFKVLAVPGNLDTKEAAKALEERMVLLHGKTEKASGWKFSGWGGGLAGSPGTLLNSEEEIKAGLEALPAYGENRVLVTHLPPFGTSLDHAHDGHHIGSRAVKQFIEERQPRLHLCGHCHEAFGQEKLGKALSVNIGSVKDGRALLAGLGKEIKLERLEI